MPDAAATSEWSIVIPHYTNAQRTITLIESIRSGFDGMQEPEIIVVDDCSPDGSGEILQIASKEHGFVLLLNRKNSGFGPTLNRGAAMASGRLIAFSNTDIEFDRECPSGKVLTVLASSLSEPDIGAAMPLVFNSALGEVENLNEIWASRGLLWLKRKRNTFHVSGAEDTVLCGAFFAMRRTDFLRFGGFEPKFVPFFWEDVELGERIGASGLRVVACGGATVVHNHDGSIGPSAGHKKKWDVMRSNQLRFTRRWGSHNGIRAGGFWRSLRAVRCLARREFGLCAEYLGLK